ncbi:MAG: hypothetical protein ACLPJH_20025 [Myxococcaceae bacterium]
MSRASWHVAFLLVLLALLGPGFAWASASYPAEIQSQLGLSYTPACAICHANGVTGYGTVTTPFGEAMRAVGLVCCSIPSLDGALAALEAENSPYISYLKQGLDPNNPGAGSVPQPTYGCFSVTGQGPTRVGGGALLALVLLGLTTRRRWMLPGAQQAAAAQAEEAGED